MTTKLNRSQESGLVGVVITPGVRCRGRRYYNERTLILRFIGASLELLSHPKVGP